MTYPSRVRKRRQGWCNESVACQPYEGTPTRRALLIKTNALQKRLHKIASPKILLSKAATAAQYEESEYDSHG